LFRRSPGAARGTPTDHAAEAIALATRYFAGEPADFSAVPLDLSGADPFFAAVYAALSQVAWGRTTTYGALAATIGAPREAARDVGRAMAKNPAPLIVPCGGRLGGFSAPGGAQTKARMLRLEGIDVGPAESAQAAFAF
jgi:methylated-DNA-[protein]-cysteine S-methyltransferase